MLHGRLRRNVNDRTVDDRMAQHNEDYEGEGEEEEEEVDDDEENKYRVYR